MNSYWRIVKTENGHEPDVAKALDKLGFETFLPMELRRHTSKGRPAAYVEHPLIPRRVFFVAELSMLIEIRKGRHVTGFERDPEGFPETIPAAQMESFRECHAKWLQEAQRRAVAGKLNGRGIKAKLKYMPAHEALKLIQHRMEARAE